MTQFFLSRCLFYIAMNMVKTGVVVVAHPENVIGVCITSCANWMFMSSFFPPLVCIDYESDPEDSDKNYSNNKIYYAFL